jgi:hypothetical protein
VALMNQKKRLERLEAAATPPQMILGWMKAVQCFATEPDYNKWVAQDPRERRAGRTLDDCYRRWMNARIDLKLGLTKRQARDTFRELAFRYHLFWNVNELAVTKTKLAAIYLLLFRGVGSQCESETAAAIRAELHHYVARFEDLDGWSCLWLASDLAERALKDSSANPELPNPAKLEEQLSALDAALRGLVRDGLISSGATVCLQPQARGLLSILDTPSLVEHNWVDAYAIELAEFAALISARDAETENLSAVPTDDITESGFDLEVSRLRAEAKKRLGRFPGRTRKIGGRTYLHIDDYLGWPERKAQAKACAGIQVQSWDEFIAARGGEGLAELAGVKIYKFPRIRGGAEDVTASLISEIEPRRRAKDATCSKTAAELNEWTAALPLLVEKVVRLHVELVALRGAVDTVAEHYFGGRSPLFKRADEELDRSILEMERLANFCHAILPVAEHLARDLPRVRKGWRRVRQISPEEGAQRAAAEEEKILRRLERTAQLQTHVALGEGAAAEELRCSIIAEAWSS